MKDGFIRVCAATPDIRVADCQYNEKNIMKLMKIDIKMLMIIICYGKLKILVKM